MSQHFKEVVKDNFPCQSSGFLFQYSRHLKIKLNQMNCHSKLVCYNKPLSYCIFSLLKLTAISKDCYFIHSKHFASFFCQTPFKCEM